VSREISAGVGGLLIERDHLALVDPIPPRLLVLEREFFTGEMHELLVAVMDVLTDDLKGARQVKRLISNLLLIAAIGNTAMAIEEPKYEVIKKFEGFEIRRYEPMIVAETEVTGDFDDVGNDAFDILAGYIFGKNEESLKIEMTAPVNQKPLFDTVESGTATTLVSQSSSSDPKRSGEYLITFVMPSEFTLETLPKPKDDRVHLKEIPEKLMAAKSYSGSWSREKYLKHETALLEGVKQAGYEIIGDPIFARYNSPFTLPLLRRNEVLVEVKSTSESPTAP